MSFDPFRMFRQTGKSPYPVEVLGPEDDNGTMVENVQALSDAVVGHRIVRVDRLPAAGYGGWGRTGTTTEIVLDNGKRVKLVDTDDCCARTQVEAFLLHPERVEHMILGVGTTGGFTSWRIFAAAGDVLELTVDWSCGNPFYYSYGFNILVEDVTTPTAEEREEFRGDGA